MSDGDRNERQQPRNLTGLLRLCAETTREDTTTTSQFEEMDQERKDFLNAVLNEITVNPVDRLKECLRLILSAGDSDAEHDTVAELLEEVCEICEEIDMATDFYKIGGYQILPRLLHSGNFELRWRALELIATLVQNNPKCQETILEAGHLPALLELLDTDSNDMVKIKALYATSCLLRDLPEAQKQFEEHDGFSKIMRAMQCDVEKLKVKGAVLLTSLCSQQPAFKDTLCDIGMVDQLVGLLGQPHTACHEHMMSALLALVTDHERAQQEAQRPQLQLCSLLQNRMHTLQGKEEFQEERDYAKEIMKICFLNEVETDKDSNEACR
ncbi:hsp70-binding protein 1-like [Liolophura sinensis]|uniref:hsp70-binding protein 1-like n=1 Tax=Liolophura sinensis TaxID=3198878 RepID=UPI0031586EC5